MNEERQRERRQTLVIILVVLLVAILCWLPIGFRMFWPSAPHAPEPSAVSPKR